MSETCAWLCGMHLGFLTNDADLFRDNERRLFACYNEYRSVKKEDIMWEVLYGVPGLLYCFLELQRDYDKHENPNFRTNMAPVSQSLTK